MALIKCKECGNEISTKAEACPKCGAKVAQNAGCGTVFGAIFLGVILIVVLSSMFGSSSETGAEETANCKPDDLQCLGDKGVIAAGVYCKNNIEKMALHSVKWTDGTFDMKFSHFRWKDKTNGVITYIGDKVEFQNGFGAFTPMTYECDLGPDNKMVLDVRLTEGRLP